MTQPNTDDLVQHWWPCTLLPPTPGLTHTMTDEETGDSQSVPLLRVLYDARPELGYDDAITSDVCFLGEHLVYDVGEDNTTVFKREGEEWEPADVDLTPAPQPSGEVSSVASGGGARGGGDPHPGEVMFDKSRAGMAAFVDTILTQALAKVNPLFGRLPADRKLAVAEVVSRAKAKIVDAMVVRLEGVEVVTREHVAGVIEAVGEGIEDVKREVFGGGR